MEGNPNTFIKLSEIEEGLDKRKAEKLMREGWVYLGLRVTRETDRAGNFTDEIHYIVGKPS
jgi:hypothetical protein